jgi:hypothetical protein
LDATIILETSIIAPMGRKLKFDRRKNYERALKLSIPLATLKVLPLHMSLPISVYANAPVSNGKHLGDRLRANTSLLPRGWSMADTDTAHTTVYKVQSGADGAVFMCSLVLHTDLTWTLTMGSTIITPAKIPTAPIAFKCLQEVIDLLTTVDRSKLCIGNPDERYSCLLHHQGNLYDQSGKFNTNHNYTTHETITNLTKLIRIKGHCSFGQQSTSQASNPACGLFPSTGGVFQW